MTTAASLARRLASLASALADRLEGHPADGGAALALQSRLRDLSSQLLAAADTLPAPRAPRVAAWHDEQHPPRRPAPAARPAVVQGRPARPRSRPAPARRPPG